MYDLVKDISDITQISKNTLDKIVSKCVYCICDDVETETIKNETITRIDIGIGDLLISTEDSEVKYKFIPSARLNASVINTIIDKKNPLINELQESIKKKVTLAYKDMF